jgi:RNA polymerase sigma-70 factor (ECF subfamily)
MALAAHRAPRDGAARPLVEAMSALATSLNCSGVAAKRGRMVSTLDSHDGEVGETVAVTIDDLEAHRGALVHHCRRMMHSSSEAEDAAQETIVRAWRNLDRFEGRSSVRSWLWRIATNVCIDMTRSPQRRAIAAEPSTLTAFGVADDDPVDHAVVADEVRAAFGLLASRLTARQRAALVLRDVYRLPAADTAERLGVSVASVNSALQRARSALAAA